jgi:hypothetical protein
MSKQNKLSVKRERRALRTLHKMETQHALPFNGVRQPRRRWVPPITFSHTSPFVPVNATSAALAAVLAGDGPASEPSSSVL